VRDDHGEIITWVGINLDISRLKQTEKVLQEANVQLAEVDRRKNEFLAMLSHELRNPLAPITNSIYVLDRATPDSEQSRRALRIIRRQVGQLARLVDDLLDVTRISRNKIQLQRGRLELGELVRHTIEDHRSLFERAGVQVVFEPLGQEVHMDGDWNRLSQVLGNLLQNAAKFTGKGGITRVALDVDRRERRAVLTVSDTGVGMAPDMLARLFQPFSQADCSLDRSKGGLGLGLALVKGLTELHGGEVSARSAGLGKGSEFVIRLPMVVEEAMPAVLPATMILESA
jgi:two-component system CheB/CheR fusion protein